VRIDILTNLQPIVAGDEITIAIRPETWEAFTTVYYRIEVATPIQKTLMNVSAFSLENDWVVDVVGQQVVFQVTAFPVVHSGFSDPVTINPFFPVLTAPEDGELLHAGSPYTFSWEQKAPAPTSYRLRFSTDGAQTFPELGGDFPGGVESITRNVPPTPTDEGRVRLEGMWPGFDSVFNPPIEVKTTNQILLHVATPTAWHIGENGTVNWTVAGDVDHYTVDLTRNSGQSWTTLVENLPGSQHHLTVPVDPPASTSARVRVKAFGPTGSTVATSGAFRIGSAPPRRGGRGGPRD
jgi:hypothetical protein